MSDEQKISAILDPAGVLSEPGVVVAPGAIRFQTGEQALAEGRGKIELPEVIEIAKSYGDLEPSPEVASAQLTPLDSKAFAEALIKVNTEAGLTVIAQTQDETIVTQTDEGHEDSAIVDRAPVEPSVEVAQEVMDTLIAPKTNILGTQDICPDKHNCKHRGADYCKQARLEADHKAGCPNCTCFHPGRGIPSVFRGGN